MRSALLCMLMALFPATVLAQTPPPSQPAQVQRTAPAATEEAQPVEQVSARTKIARVLWTFTVGAMLLGGAGVVAGLAVGGGLPFILNAAGNDVEFSSIAGILGLIILVAGIACGMTAWPLMIAAIIVGWNSDEGPPGYQH